MVPSSTEKGNTVSDGGEAIAFSAPLDYKSMCLLGKIFIHLMVLQQE